MTASPFRFRIPKAADLRRAADADALSHAVVRVRALQPADRLFLPTLRDGIRRCVEAMRDDRAIRSMTCLVLACDDSIKLLQIGPRGGHKTLWNFGHGR